MFVCSVLADVPLVTLQWLINWQGTGSWSTAEPGKGQDLASPPLHHGFSPISLAGGTVYCQLPSLSPLHLRQAPSSPAGGTALGGMSETRASPHHPGSLHPALVASAEPLTHGVSGTHGSPLAVGPWKGRAHKGSGLGCELRSSHRPSPSSSRQIPPKHRHSMVSKAITDPRQRRGDACGSEQPARTSSRSS